MDSATGRRLLSRFRHSHYLWTPTRVQPRLLGHLLHLLELLLNRDRVLVDLITNPRLMLNFQSFDLSIDFNGFGLQRHFEQWVLAGLHTVGLGL